MAATANTAVQACFDVAGTVEVRIELRDDDQSVRAEAKIYGSPVGYNYAFLDGEDTLEVQLRWHGEQINVTKTYRFERGSYLIEVLHEVENKGDVNLDVSAISLGTKKPVGVAKTKPKTGAELSMEPLLFSSDNPDQAMLSIRLRTALRYPRELDITSEVMEELSLEPDS